MNELEQRLPTILEIVLAILRTLLGRWVAGEITRAEFVQSAALAVATSRIRGANIGADAVRREIEAQLEEPVRITPPNLSRDEDTTRLIKAVETIVEGVPESPDTQDEAFQKILDDIDMRFERLARAETAKAAQDGAQQALADERVEGWVRDRNGDACTLCDWWWREGRVWPKTYSMPRHTGCECWPRPVTTRYIQNPTKKGWDRSARDEKKEIA